jgi:general nucleoside transport system ATP-binding protein
VKLELRGITKRFPGVLANENVDLVVQPGEIHGLLGENGAGKTTLMNVLYGLYQPDEGEIRIDDQLVRFHDPGDAIAAGIGMVHQHFMLIPVFTVAENVVLGVEHVTAGRKLDRARAAQEVAAPDLAGARALPDLEGLAGRDVVGAEADGVGAGEIRDATAHDPEPLWA